MRSIFAIGLLFSSWILSTSALAGPSCNGNYLLEKTFPSGAKWQLCWEHRQREGIVYHDMFYTPPGGLEKRILNQTNMAQIHVPYDDNGARYHDVSDYGLGGTFLNDLQSNDCPGGELRGENDKNMLCLLTRERNHAHAFHVGNADKHKIGQYFEFFSVSHVGAYNYMPTWRLYDDGTIEVLMGATGSLQRFRTGSQYQANGWLLNSSDKYGVSHLHNYYWRLDFDLGTNANDDIVEEIEFINQNGNLSRIKSITPFTTEVARSIAPDKYRSWQIRDGANSNGLGHAIAYQIEPLLTGHRDEGPSYEPWTHNDFYVTVNKSCEKYASHNPEVSGCTDNLSSFVNGQSLSGADVVIWYGLSFHHIPRDEDEPKMHAHWNSFKIIPRNVTIKNPLADISGSSNTPPVLSDPGDQTNTIGETISVALTASDIDGDSLTYSANGLPDGLSITSSGVISGTPTNTGTYLVTITVNDGTASNQKTFNWNINQVGAGGCSIYDSSDVPVEISSSGSLTVTSDLNVAQTGIITDVNVLNLKGRHTYMSDLDFKLTSPTGTTVQIINNSCSSTNNFDLNLDSTSTSGWPCPPIDAGTYKPSETLNAFNGEQSAGNWVLTLHDRANLDGGNLDQWALEICLESVAPPNQPPALTSPGNQSNLVGDQISLAINASDPDGDALTFSASGLPSGLQINTSGTVSGTIDASAAGPHAVEITVDDGQGHTPNIGFGWQVDALNQDPVITNPGDQINTEGDEVSVAIVASDPDNDTLSFIATGLPAGLTIDTDSGIISGTLSVASNGSYTVTVTIDDGQGHEENTTFNWEITTRTGSMIVRKIQTGIDDVEERSNGSMYRYSSDLELVKDGSVQKVGLRYQNIALPQGVTITKAWIQFQADENNSELTTLNIHAEATDNGIAFSNNNGDISNRILTSASSNWSPEPWNTVGEAGMSQRTSDLAAIVQEVLNRPGWQNGNALIFIVTGNGKRVAESFNGNSSAAPTLHIEYESTGNFSISQAILASEDDVEELSNGSIYLNSSDLELTQESSQQKIGLRFRNFPLPQGANITRAWIQFQTDEVSTTTTDLLIQAEDSDSAAGFSNNTSEVSNRVLLSDSVSWIPSAWNTAGEASSAQQTPDIKTLIQDVVDRPGWNSGNALVFVITGIGRRVAESYDGDSSGAPRLFVEYQ